MRNYNRKGQAVTIMSSMVGVALLLIVLFITVSLGGQISDQLVSSEAASVNRSVVNESFNVSQNTFYNFANKRVVNSIRQITNSSAIVDVGNFTYAFSSARLNLTGATYSNRILNLTYSYDGDTESAPRNISRKGQEGLQAGADLFTTLTLIVVAAFVLGIMGGIYFLVARR